ncbi:alpha/beta fold hydrolase [Promicromonospora sp. NPDC050880]|uniref:alpha/beta fold hydrolase n=1 Tax=Promicromonospora sp. NPDC050880 TaxID=3364406 RepID=UPI0037A41DC0
MVTDGQEADRRVDVGGHELRVRVQGTGPVVVLEAGGAGQGVGAWGTVPELLAPSATVVTYDRAGVGRSGGSQARTLAEQADGLRRLLDALGPGGPVVLVGWSYGGLVTQVFAARHPDDVAGLVFVDPTAAGVPPGSDRVRRWSFGVMHWLLRVRASRGGTDGAALRELAFTLRGMPDAMVEAALAREARGLPSVPTRVVVAGRRPAMPRAQREHLDRDHAALAGAPSRGRVLVAGRAGHQIPAEQPDAIVQVVQEVLHDAGGRGRA